MSVATLSTAGEGLTRIGLKGPQAPAWLAAHSIAVPSDPNRWCAIDDGACLRLGIGELFLEGGAGVGRLADALAPGPGVYPVLRQDTALVLAGDEAEAVLAQACAYDFATQPADAVVLTSMLGVSTQVIWRDGGGGRAYHLWCDASFGPYFTAALAGIVRESGGNVSLPKAGGKG